MAQSSLSALVRRFETAVGHQVFERSSRRVAVAPAGAGAIDTVDRILQTVAELSPEGRASGMTGFVRLGAIPTLAAYLTPHILGPLRASFGDAKFLFTEALTEQLTAALRAERLDAALLSLPLKVRGLEEFPLFEEELVLALPRGHALSTHARIPRARIPSGEMILMDHGHCLRDNTLKVCGDIRSGVPTHATGIETLSAMVAAGVGCAVLPALAALRPRGLDDLVELRRFTEPVPTRTVGLVAKSGSIGAARSVELLRVLRELDFKTSL